MIIRNPTNGSIGIAIHSIIQLTIAKKQPKKFLGWGSVGLVFKKGYYFLRVPKVILTAAPTTAGFWPVPEISCKG